MITVLAIVGAVVLMRQIYLHIVRHQKLKTENECLRRYWKESMMDRF